MLVSKAVELLTKILEQDPNATLLIRVKYESRGCIPSNISYKKVNYSDDAGDFEEDASHQQVTFAVIDCANTLEFNNEIGKGFFTQKCMNDIEEWK